MTSLRACVCMWVNASDKRACRARRWAMSMFRMVCQSIASIKLYIDVRTADGNSYMWHPSSVPPPQSRRGGPLPTPSLTTSTHHTPILSCRQPDRQAGQEAALTRDWCAIYALHCSQYNNSRDNDGKYDKYDSTETGLAYTSPCCGQQLLIGPAMT